MVQLEGQRRGVSCNSLACSIVGIVAFDVHGDSRDDRLGLVVRSNAAIESIPIPQHIVRRQCAERGRHVVGHTYDDNVDLLTLDR